MELVALTTVELYPAYTFSLRMFTALRKELAPFKQREIAEVMGVTEARVSTILSGGQNITVETITRLLMAAEKLNKRVKVAPC